MNSSQVIVRILFVLVTLLYCTAVNATAAETRIETTLANGGNATIVFADSPLKTMTETPFAIELYEASGDVINDAELALDLTMPFMPMPPNKPNAAWQGNAYHGIAIFTMAGAWQVNVEIKRSDSEMEKIIFDIEMVVMK
jgi:hypothetical protein